MSGALRPALVVAAHGSRGHIELEDGAVRRYLVRGRRLRVVCGDRVRVAPADGDAPLLVEAVEPRRNALERVAPRAPHPEILAANLSALVLVVAPVPEPDWFLADRFVCAGELMGARVIIVANKADRDGLAEPALDLYRSLGYRVHHVSAHTAAGLAALAADLAGETAVIVGQSGVGKSSLINRLVPGAAAETGAVSARSGEGTHTTTAAVMHRLPGGGRLIDAPGVRDFVPFIESAARVQGGFVEIAAAAVGCRFADCRHLREPGCAVKAAVAAGRIAERRHEAYRRLLRGLAG